jgi:Cys-tRNA(Pro)/Cys-tRNA(Cys) deacylase
MEKTNVMRILDQKKIPYTARSYDPSLVEGILVADTLSIPREDVFKTLVAVSAAGEHLVFVVPSPKSWT